MLTIGAREFIEYRIRQYQTRKDLEETGLNQSYPVNLTPSKPLSMSAIQKNIEKLLKDW